MNDTVLIFLRGENNLRDVVWTLLEAELILTADSVIRHEAFLKDGSKRKMGSNQNSWMLVTRQALLDSVMARIQEVAKREQLSAYAVPVLATVSSP